MKDTPVLVIGLCIHGLAIARTLSQAGITVYAIESNRSLPGVSTRYARVSLVDSIIGQDLVNELIVFAEQHCFSTKPIVYPTNDNMVKTIADNQKVLDDYYRISWGQSGAEILQLQQKKVIKKYCDNVGLHHPVTHIVENHDDCLSIINQLEFPQLIKPNQPLSAFKAIKLNSQQELEKCLIDYPEEYPFVLQTWIEGGAQSLIFCAAYLDNGQPLVSFTGRKLEALPKGVGQAIAVESLEDSFAYRYCKDFFSQTKLCGPVALEFKRDESGKYWVIEPNVGRTEYLTDCSTMDGVNIPLTQYLQLTGAEQVWQQQRSETIWFDTERDITVYLKHIIQAKSFYPLGKKPVFPYNYWHDPMPMMRNFVTLIQRIVKAIIKRIRQLPEVVRNIISILNYSPQTKKPPDLDVEVNFYYSFTELPVSAVSLLEDASKKQVFDSDYWYSGFENLILPITGNKPIYVVLMDSDKTIMVLPLMTDDMGFFKVPVLRSLGNYYTSLYSPVINRDYISDNEADLKQYFSLIARKLLLTYPKVARLILRPLDADSESYFALKSGFTEANYITETSFCFINWYKNLETLSYVEYFTARPAFLRNLIKRKGNKLKREKVMRIQVFTDVNDLDTGLQDFETVYAKSWKIEEPYPDFIRHICREQSKNGRLRLGILYVDNVPAAAQIWFKNGSVAAVFKLAYDDDYSNYSVGNLLLNAMIEFLFENDSITGIDMLEGDDSYKKNWVEFRRDRRDLEFINPFSLWGKLILIKHYLNGDHKLSDTFISE